MSLSPIADRIIIQPLTPEQETAGGIIIPPSAQKKSKIGIIRAVDKPVQHEDDVPLYPGDQVYFEENAGIEIEHEGVKCRVVRKASVIFKWN